MMRIDPYEVYSVVTGSIRLDGGAMFGVVPKVLWESVADVDEANRILLKTRTLLAVNRGECRVILVDTGCGTKWTPEKAGRFAIHYDEDAVPETLASMGLSANEVTDVVITHLHFDHNGGLTEWFDDPDGPTTLRYPQARHWVHRRSDDDLGTLAHVTHPCAGLSRNCQASTGSSALGGACSSLQVVARRSKTSSPKFTSSRRISDRLTSSAFTFWRMTSPAT